MARDTDNREREERERQKAELAFNDYFFLGPNRSIAALFNLYVKKAQEEGPTSVPTRHRPKLTNWRRLYNWDVRCQELENKDIDSKYRDYETIRRIRSDELLDLSDKAVETLRNLLIKEDVKDNIRFMAAEAVLDRVGLTRKSRQPNNEKSQLTVSSTPPPPDADQSTLEEYWANREG